MRELPHTRSCFVCGETNPLGLRQRFATDGRLVHAEFTPRPEHCGFAGVVHGGVLATVLDEIMVWACAVGTRQFAFCAEMTTRFHHPAQPGEILQVEAELVAAGRLLSIQRSIHGYGSIAHSPHLRRAKELAERAVES